MSVLEHVSVEQLGRKYKNNFTEQIFESHWTLQALALELIYKVLSGEKKL